ncbi:MAG: DUF5050 domain-containing protein [Ruminococcaceae bacterium]|nr:DUF5050 domain-containing protein [Oscillospiraceae bacterium]
MNQSRRYSSHAGGKSLPSWAVLLISVLLAMLSILIVYFTFFAKDSQSVNEPQTVMTDGAGNRANGSCAVSNGNMIFYSRSQNGGDSGVICAFNKTTQETVELCSSGGRYLVLDADRILFCEYSSGYLYSVTDQGENLTVLRSGHTADIILRGGYIYYCDRSGDSPHIGRINRDGTGDTVLLEGWYESLTLVGDDLYFSDTDNGGLLCSMPIGGGEKTTVLAIPVDDVQSVGQTIYFTDLGSGSICSYKPGEKNAAVIFSGRGADCINVIGSRIYFHDSSRGAIFSIGTDASGELQIAACDAVSITITDGYLFYIDSASRDIVMIPLAS